MENPIKTLTISSAATSIGSRVFKDNKTLTRITLPANMSDDNLKTFDEAFVNYYKNQKKSAGIYQKRGQIWTKITAAEAARLDKEAAEAEALAKAEAEAAAKAEAKARAEREAAEAKAGAEREAARAEAAAMAAFEKVIPEVFEAEALKYGFPITVQITKEAVNRYNRNPQDVKTILVDCPLEITGYTGKAKELRIPGEIAGAAVTSVAPGAFQEQIAAGKVSAVVIPDTVETIGEGAFSALPAGGGKAGKSKLASVTLGAGLKEIGEGAFEGNAALKTVVFKSSPAVGTNAFAGCPLASVTLPAGMDTVDNIDPQLAADYGNSGSSAGVYVKTRKGWSKKS